VGSHAGSFAWNKLEIVFRGGVNLWVKGVELADMERGEFFQDSKVKALEVARCEVDLSGTTREKDTDVAVGVTIEGCVHFTVKSMSIYKSVKTTSN
jgi:hypothetical protein